MLLNKLTDPTVVEGQPLEHLQVKIEDDGGNAMKDKYFQCCCRFCDLHMCCTLPGGCLRSCQWLPGTDCFLASPQMIHIHKLVTISSSWYETCISNSLHTNRFHPHHTACTFGQIQVNALARTNAMGVATFRNLSFTLSGQAHSL